MIIKALVENTSISKDYRSTHGLSLYIETKKHKMLFDLGPGKLFYENAVKMDIDIEDVDTVVISHGHYDHGGALKTFIERNKKAKIYISEAAFQPYYAGMFGAKFYIGLDQALKSNDRFIFTKGTTFIDDELQLFSDVENRNYTTNQKSNLYQKIGKKYITDTFLHEQDLLIYENGAYTLFAGCAHNGIINILEKAESITGTEITTVFGGFHLMQLHIHNAGNRKYLTDLAFAMKEGGTKFYTCHCTGKKVYSFLHKEVGEQMNYISTGTTIQL